MEKTARPTHLMIESLNERVSDTRKMVSVGIALVLAFSAATFGLTLGAAEFAKEAHVTGNASVMTDVSGNAVSTKALYRTVGLEDVCAFDAETMATYLAEAKDITLVNDGVNAKYTIAGFEHNLNTNEVELFTNKGSLSMESVCRSGEAQGRKLLGRTARVPIPVSGQKQWQCPHILLSRCPGNFNFGEWIPYNAYIPLYGNGRGDKREFHEADDLADYLDEREKECDDFNKQNWAACQECNAVFSYGSFQFCGDPDTSAADQDKGSGQFSYCQIAHWKTSCKVPHLWADDPYQPGGVIEIFLSAEVKIDNMNKEYLEAEVLDKCDNKNCYGYGTLCWETACDIMLTGVDNFPGAREGPVTTRGMCKTTRAKDSHRVDRAPMLTPVPPPCPAGAMVDGKCSASNFLPQAENACIDANAWPHQVGLNCNELQNNFNDKCNGVYTGHGVVKVYAHSWGTVYPAKCDLAIEYAGGMCATSNVGCWTTRLDPVPRSFSKCCHGHNTDAITGMGPIPLTHFGHNLKNTQYPWFPQQRRDGFGDEGPQDYADISNHCGYQPSTVDFNNWEEKVAGTSAPGHLSGGYQLAHLDSEDNCSGVIGSALTAGHCFAECYEESLFGGPKGITRMSGDPYVGLFHTSEIVDDYMNIAPVPSGSSTGGGTASYGSSTGFSSTGSSYSGMGFMGF